MKHGGRHRPGCGCIKESHGSLGVREGFPPSVAPSSLRSALRTTEPVFSVAPIPPPCSSPAGAPPLSLSVDFLLKLTTVAGRNPPLLPPPPAPPYPAVASWCSCFCCGSGAAVEAVEAVAARAAAAAAAAAARPWAALPRRPDCEQTNILPSDHRYHRSTRNRSSQPMRSIPAIKPRKRWAPLPCQPGLPRKLSTNL